MTSPSSENFDVDERPSTPIYDYDQFKELDLKESPHKGIQGVRGAQYGKVGIIDTSSVRFTDFVMSSEALKRNAYTLIKNGYGIDCSGKSLTEQLIEESANNAGFPLKKIFSTKF